MSTVQDGAKRRPRGTLDRAMVASAALEMIEEHGVDALTMRSLASDIGCGTMTLYRYVSDREDLLESVVEILISELDIARLVQHGDQRPVGWPHVFREVMAGYRELAFRRPRAFELLALAPYESMPVLPHLEDTIRAFTAAGLSYEDALLLLGLADAFATGFLAVWVRSGSSEHRTRLGQLHNRETYEQGLTVIQLGFERLLETQK